MDVAYWSAGIASCYSFSPMATVLSRAPPSLPRGDGAPFNLEAACSCGRAELDHSRIALGVPGESQARDAASELRQCNCDDHRPVRRLSLPPGKRKADHISD